MEFASSVLNVSHILQTGGLLALAIIIFAETGLLLGFFLPGDTLLITAGILSAQHKLPLAGVLIVAAAAAIAGYQVGYRIGASAGPRFFTRKDGLFFRHEYIGRTEELVAKYGAGAILLARFIAVVRTVVPIIAGMGRMNKNRFLYFNLVGGILWTASVTLASFWLGRKIPNIDKIIIPLLILAMVVTSGSVLFGLMRSRAKRSQLRQALREEFNYFFKR